MDRVCERCGWRVGGGEEAKDLLEAHVRRDHPEPVAEEPAEEAPPRQGTASRLVERVFGDAVPQSTGDIKGRE
jgi:hypothetical protein